MIVTWSLCVYTYSRLTSYQMADVLMSPDEAFISENVCTSVLTESKASIKRCQEV